MYRNPGFNKGLIQEFDLNFQRGGGAPSLGNENPSHQGTIAATFSLEGGSSTDVLYVLYISRPRGKNQHFQAQAINREAIQYMIDKTKHTDRQIDKEDRSEV